MVKAQGPMKNLDDFADILKSSEPLAPHSYLRLGGPAEALARPRSVEELTALARRCRELRIPLRVLGNGCSVLIRDEGVPGVVARLSEPVFTSVVIRDGVVRAGAGAALAAVIAETARHGLAGLETLVGIPGTLGGALHHPAGDGAGNIASFVRVLETIDEDAQCRRRGPDELEDGAAEGLARGAIIVAAELALEPDSADAIVKRMRKAWIQRKAAQPPSFQPAIRVFRDPRGWSAEALIEQAALAGTRVGGAQLSERNPNFLVLHPGASARDVLRLVDLVRSQVRDRLQIELEMEMSVW